MSETQKEPLVDSSAVNVKKKLLIAIDNTMERKFAEEVEYLDGLGGDGFIRDNLGIDFMRGIATTEVETRREKYGTNRKAEKASKGYLEILWATLGDFTLIILLIASGVSIIINVATEEDHRNIAWIEGFAIFVAVMISANVQAFNDYEKEKQFKKLNAVSEGRKTLSLYRDGIIKEVHQSELVVGDIVKIQEGTDVPADGYVIEAAELTTDESAMTGETDPIRKNNLIESLNKKSQIEEEGGRNTAGHHDVYSPILLAGTKILTGEGKYVVILVGKDSSIGKIRDLLDQDVDATPLQQKLEKIAGDIGKFGLISAVIVFGILFIRFLAERGRSDTWGDGSKWVEILDFFIIAITVIVVAIPEGLPLAVALSLAYSVGRMLKDNNLVRRLHACETMGGANNICSDKTGTLTQNKMDLSCFWNEQIVEINVYDKGQSIANYVTKPLAQDLMLQALVCNSSATLEPLTGSKTEIALLQFCEGLGVNLNEMQKKYLPQGHTKFPFTSKRKRMSTVLENVSSAGLSNKRMHIKGASEFILESCNQFYILNEDRVVPITTELRAQIERSIKDMADKALRTIGIAYKDVVGGEDFQTKDDRGVFSIEKEGFTLIGMLGIKDMLRKEVKDAVAKCMRAGIKVRMVTGDNKDTARAIAKECGIIDPANPHSRVMEGTEFQELIGGVICKNCKTKECDCPRDKATADKKKKSVREDIIQNRDAFKELFPYLDVLARSRPEDKYALVTGLREFGNVVAVTGDGTNDAPALKKADVGFAMGIAGTEVAREAADIILLDDNFNSIVAAVQWGRNIYDSIKKFLQFQLTVNVVAVGLTLLGSAIYKMTILSPVQMLWVNLIMDTLASLALATESPSPQLLLRHPHDKDEYIISRKMMKFIACHATYQIIIIMLLVTLGDQFIPEWSDLDKKHDWLTVDGVRKQVRFSHYGNGHQYVISGRMNYATGDPDYEKAEKECSPSRHFTVIFNTFVFLQIFNFVNARKLEDEYNIFEGLKKSPLFVIIIVIIIILQIILGMVGNRPLEVHVDGTNGAQWGISIALGSGEWIIALISKSIPETWFPQIGKNKQDPIRHPSKILSVKRSLEQRSQSIRHSTLMAGEAKKSSLSNKISPSNY